MAGDDDDLDPMAHAADEPTAMWDEAALAKLGLDKDGNPSDPPPATAASPKGESSVQVDLPQVAHDPGKAPGGGAKKGSGLSWAVTIALAIGLGVGVYFVVRMLR
ncbi:MAG TPA: hypothetical protein RMH85_00945 [Polyangiaceae bacterium LLY-WYZ-15_(1-7)]|nr:hypothetical protein [Polyangiaceae bacterium LLY-WYZ-15_(1-7)]HJL00333.1 hypothetical protein [Polyangiaceae bacterium LLY-WYZ-15_(1-7)]HJL07028.1 hypothetical protein [Polyangiaceae bacterium LLY-WYZ-15_(1-7)]HJL26660.1 hypothetical protein [Polyangiaceae bacterium LLY-WYZ-15_(1-7)]HJL35029.1 hypothetical protein [Polyangiaceae bacterium LLY-WYZ-15_(1-7)]